MEPSSSTTPETMLSGSCDVVVRVFFGCKFEPHCFHYERAIIQNGSPGYDVSKQT